jgi:hypothetical protein
MIENIFKALKEGKKDSDDFPKKDNQFGDFSEAQIAHLIGKHLSTLGFYTELEVKLYGGQKRCDLYVLKGNEESIFEIKLEEYSNGKFKPTSEQIRNWKKDVNKLVGNSDLRDQGKRYFVLFIYGLLNEIAESKVKEQLLPHKLFDPKSKYGFTCTGFSAYNLKKGKQEKTRHAVCVFEFSVKA